MNKLNLVYSCSPLFTSEVIAPIILQGDPIGAVMLLSKEPTMKMGALEIKLVETAAAFLAKQME